MRRMRTWFIFMIIKLLLTFHCYKGSSSSCESVGDIIEPCAPCEEREVRRRRRRNFYFSQYFLRLLHKYQYVCSYETFTYTKDHPIIIYNNISLLSPIILTHSHTHTQTTEDRRLLRTDRIQTTREML